MSNTMSATCTMVIENFSTSTVQQQHFTVPPDNKTTTLVLCMNSEFVNNNHNKEKFVSFFLFLFKSPNQDRIAVQYRMSIVNASGQKCNTQEGKVSFSQHDRFRGHYILSRNHLLDSENELLVNDTLTVHCEVQMIGSHLEECSPTGESIKQSTILHDYGSLFESGKLSDAVLVAGGTEFKVHKNILSARSAVFCAMFEHDTKEKQENRIVVENVSGGTYHELLRYIYTDKVDNMEENALELMAAADKYQLDHLKSLCEQYLCSILATESVVTTLVMADLYRAEALKNKCLDYICDNARDVKNTEGWKELTHELMTEVVLRFYDKQNK